MRRLRHDRSDQIIRQQMHPDFLTNHFRCFTPQNIHLENCFDESEIHFDKPPFRVKFTELLSCNFFWVNEGSSNDFSIAFDLAYCQRVWHLAIHDLSHPIRSLFWLFPYNGMVFFTKPLTSTEITFTTGMYLEDRVRPQLL